MRIIDWISDVCSSDLLNSGAILEVAKSAQCDAIHPGYGFLSENAHFARAVENAGMIWIGPTPECIIAMGDKHHARELAQNAGVPVLPGSQRIAQTDDEIGRASCRERVCQYV